MKPLNVLNLRKLIPGFAIAMALSTGIAFGSSDDLTSVLREDLMAFENAIQASTVTPTNSLTSNDWNLTLFYLRFQPEAGFNLGTLVKAKIIPEVELVWQKQP